MTHPVETFFKAWGDPDADTRNATLRTVIADDLYYADPNTPAPLNGAEDFLGYVGMFAANMSGAGAQVAAISEHNGHARATVDFVKDGTTMMRGQYFADFGADGRIARMVGFVGTGGET